MAHFHQGKMATELGRLTTLLQLWLRGNNLSGELCVSEPNVPKTRGFQTCRVKSLSPSLCFLFDPQDQFRPIWGTSPHSKNYFSTPTLLRVGRPAEILHSISICRGCCEMLCRRLCEYKIQLPSDVRRPNPNGTREPDFAQAVDLERQQTHWCVKTVYACGDTQFAQIVVGFGWVAFAAVTPGWATDIIPSRDTTQYFSSGDMHRWCSL